MVERVVCVGREPTVLPVMHDIYIIVMNFFNICNSEAERVGIIKRKLEIEMPEAFLSVVELANMV